MTNGWLVIRILIATVSIVMGFYFGIFEQEYARGCFNLLLAIVISPEVIQKDGP